MTDDYRDETPSPNALTIIATDDEEVANLNDFNGVPVEEAEGYREVMDVEEVPSDQPSTSGQSVLRRGPPLHGNKHPGKHQGLPAQTTSSAFRSPAKRPTPTKSTPTKSTPTKSTPTKSTATRSGDRLPARKAVRNLGSGGDGDDDDGEDNVEPPPKKPKFLVKHKGVILWDPEPSVCDKMFR